ncbi:MAG: ribonuclease PH [Planctomycetota bacterium]|nr:ribonuclease PH [Planctomycetota bacterium]
MPRTHAADATREVRFERNFPSNAPGSVLACFGETQVLCTATYTESVPMWMKGRGNGWLTAEYSMLPASTDRRKPRDRAGKIDGRSVEIQRLIGRSVRAAVDMKLLGERTIWVDCDVLKADGGTRTAAISGAYVAVYDCLMAMGEKRLLRVFPMRTQLGAVSVGIVKGEVLCDLCYAEDSKADVDMNLVMTGEGEFIEVQGSAEGKTFSRKQLDELLEIGETGIRHIFEVQRAALEAR